MCRQRSDRLTEQGETLLAVCASVKGTKQLYVTNQIILLHEIKGIVSTGNVAIIDDLPAHIALEIKSGIEI